ncbi:MAG: hypothetical protein A2Z25_12030 [Planctomycetes bacterium RBG_16_55_9]|nr:MAG: hypothetical protein A2Z25_12030 [Planctomycetes bacterium RBG_16_55_9]
MPKPLTTESIAPALLSILQTCEYLSISRPTLYKLAASGKLGPKPISLCRKVLYRRVELDQWIAAGCPHRRAWSSMKGGIISDCQKISLTG